MPTENKKKNLLWVEQFIPSTPGLVMVAMPFLGVDGELLRRYISTYGMRPEVPGLCAISPHLICAEYPK
jgi:hypothetical protein